MKVHAITSALAAGALLFAVACSPQEAPVAPADAAETAEAIALTVPAGDYTLDKGHASLTVRVNHLGLSNYTMRFTDFDATLAFNPEDVTASSVTATINPASIRTDYPGDYCAGHDCTVYRTWDEDVARNPRWLNADEHGDISFTSTSLTQTGPNTGTMTGDLTFRGVTQPVTLDVTFNGELNPMPFRQDTIAIGFSAAGSLDRSAFGMDAFIPNIGDAVEIIIEAEFHRPVEAAAPANAPAAE